MDESWIVAIGAVVVGVAAGLVGAALVRRGAVRGREDRPEVVEAARALAVFLFLFLAALGVIVALGVSDMDYFESVPSKLIEYSPHVLAAGLLLIVGRALGHVAAGAVHRSMSRNSERLRNQAARAVRFLVTAAAFVLALRQLGVDTTMLEIVVAAMLFGLAGAFALLVGLGGRDLTREIGHGRYLARVLAPGDDVEVSGVRGRVAALLPASVAVETDDGVVHVPNSQVFAALPRVRRPSPEKLRDF